MSIDDSYDDDGMTFENSEIPIPRSIRFWLLLLMDIPSITCSFFLLFHLLINKSLRSQLTNHVIIILLIIGLIIELIAIPLHLSFLHLGVVQPSTSFTCLIWWFIDIGLYSGYMIIMAWGSAERYLLILHHQMFLNKKKRLIFHYLPLSILCLYILVFYIIAIIFPPCINTFGYTLPVCDDFPCYLNNRLLGIWDSFINNVIPTSVVSIASIMLLTRVYNQKRRLHQPIQWRKQRKMTIQLLCGCVLSLIPNIPGDILNFAHLCGLPESIGSEVQLYFDFLSYIVILLYPFLCLGTLSELRQKIRWKGLFLLKRPRQVAIIGPQ